MKKANEVVLIISHSCCLLKGILNFGSLAKEDRTLNGLWY